MRRAIASLAAFIVAIALGAIMPAGASASPSDVTVTNTVSCGLGPGVQSIINNTADTLNIINETIQYPSGNVNFPDPFALPAGQDGGGSWSFASNEGDSAYEWIVKNADTNEVYYDQWYAFDCNTVKAVLDQTTCGTSGTFTVINGYVDPQAVYYTTLGDAVGDASTTSANIPVSTTFQAVPWSFNPAAGDSSFTLTVKNAADDSVLDTRIIRASCSTPLPVRTSAASLTGNTAIGGILTCDPGTFTGADSVAIEWLGNGTVKSGFSAPTYTVVATDAGTSIACASSASNAGGSTPFEASNALAIPIPISAPVRVSGPFLTGLARVGYVLSCHVAYTGATSETYGWKRNGVTNLPAVGSRYTLTALDYGKHITCFSSASGPGGSVPVASSTPSATVAPGFAPRVVGKYYPRIIGIPARGKYLAVYVGRWTPPPTAYRCVWYKYVGTRAVRITGAIKCTVKLRVPRTFKRGTKVLVRVYAYKTGYSVGARNTPIIKIR